MKFTRSFQIAFSLLFVWLILAWFIGVWTHLPAPNVWYLRGGLWFLGIAGFVGYLLLRPKDQGPLLEGETAQIANEIDVHFTEAAHRIQAATGNKKLNSLPALFVLGDVGSAKTSIIFHSGLEPELLAGQAMQDGAAVSTRSLNLWYSRNTLFIDPGGAAISNPATRKKLFKKFLPVRLNSVVGSNTPPARSVLLTVDCDDFLQPGGPNVIAQKARSYQTIFSELSQELGTGFPVYVLFTKADKIPYFRNFVENRTEAEAGEILGVSLPIAANATGAYAEQQSTRVTEAFQSLYYSLADARPMLLAREHEPANLPNIYEFPREFSKLRPHLVQFLTDLCRPSQLGPSPFLRGFYFSGVRPIVVNDVIPAQQAGLVEEADFDPGATRMFNQLSRSAHLAQSRPTSSRRVPQWIFLRNLFPEILLADRVGATAAKTNVKVTFTRRLAMASIAAFALAMAIWWTVSYNNNRTLVRDAVEAAQSVPAIPLPPGQLAGLDSLRRLTRVRDTLALLNTYQREGAPWSYRALLYKGNDLRQPLRQTYYALFRRLLLQPDQQTLIAICNKPENYEAQGYQYVYNVLKAYLITTNHHEKEWVEFPSVLTLHWKQDQAVESEREKLAATNFEFYASELPAENPYPQYAVPDSQAVETARAYLKRFAQEDRIYRSMLDAAAGSLKSIVFNRDYPDTEDTVRNVYRVEPWFLKLAYSNFQKQLANPDAYFAGEEWVLGKETIQNFDKAKLVVDLKARYDADYIKAWREFLAATSEALPYANYVRASKILDKLGSPQSPLMRLFCVASDNTVVSGKEVAQAFQPVQLVTPPGCMRQLVSSAAGPYVVGLGNLSNALKAIGPPNAPNQAAGQAAEASVQTAEGTATTLVSGFQTDPSDPKAIVIAKSSSLIKDPIEGVRVTLKEIAGAAVNGAAADTCAAMNPVLRKYPFNPSSKEDSTLPEVNDILRPPDGRLWKLVNGPLQPFVQLSGGEYTPVSGQQSKVTPGFLAFLNRCYRLSQALYHGDSTGNPSMTFSVQALPSQDMDHVTLVIDGVTLSADPKTKPTQTFPWPGATPSASLDVRYGNSPVFNIFRNNGLWAIWHVLDTAIRDQNGTLEWRQGTTAGATTLGGAAASVKLALDPQSAQILRPQYFAGITCTGRAVQ